MLKTVLQKYFFLLARHFNQKVTVVDMTCCCDIHHVIASYRERDS